MRPQPPAGGDDFERNTVIPEGAVRVASGRTEKSEWRLYAFRQGAEKCMHFSAQSPGGGAAARGCHKSPLGASTLRAQDELFAFGLASAAAVRVRFEHMEGASETFDTVKADDYSERFFAGKIGVTPLKRIVGLDANGKVVAEKNDMSAYNATG